MRSAAPLTPGGVSLTLALPAGCHGRQSNGIAYKDAFLHEECFVCSVCGKDFPDRKFAEKNGEFFHAEVRPPLGARARLTLAR